VGIALALIVTVLAVLLSACVVSEIDGASAQPRNAFRFFAVGLQYGIAMGGFFLVLVAGLSMAGESGQGTLKMVLVRPIHRGDLFLAKVITIFFYALALLVCVAVASAVVADVCPGVDFGDVIDPQYDDPANPYIYTESGEMWGHLFRAVALVFLPMLAAGALGLTVSVLFENPGVASGTAVVTFLALEILKEFLKRRDVEILLFNYYLPTLSDSSYVSILYGNAVGLSDAIWPAGLWIWNLLVPVVTMAGLLLFAMAVFRRKAILT
jgi:ABC-type transport system involved in multi-copper enzyme maturation permease subunit